MYNYLMLVLCVSVVVDGEIASFITKCHDLDDACHKASAQQAVSVLAAGVPELNLIPLDPMQVDRVQANQAGLSIDFRNMIVKGLRNCAVFSLKRKGKKIKLEVQCSVIVNGDYKLDGKLLVLPIEGTGKFKIKIRDIFLTVPFELTEKVVNGDKYWVIGSWRHSFDLKTGAEFQFQNLFNGNKQLSDTIHEFANSNWKEIFQEVAPPIIKGVVAKIVDEIKKLFDKVPIKNLVLD